MSILTCENLVFAYQQERILDGVSLAINRGDFAVVIGGNGTGKSTLMKLLLDELQPDEGEIHLFDQPIRSFSDWSRIGYLPQNAIERNHAFPASVEEVVRAHTYSRRKREKLSSRAIDKIVGEALASVHMADYRKSMVGELSGGQQQRVMIAGIIAADPELMLLDEPTAGIDFETVTKLYALLAELKQKRGLTLLLITHDLIQIGDYANRIYCLEQGNVVELTPEEFAVENQHRHTHPAPGHPHGAHRHVMPSGTHERICCRED